METISNIQWFPGHMAKTRRLMAQSLPMVDAVAELVDARIPISSRNPDLAEIKGNKPSIVLLNKCDLADPAATDAWLRYFKQQGIAALALDCKSGKGLNRFTEVARTLLAEQLQKNEQKGMAGRPMRFMIVGIPNVGKSSFINRMSGGSKAKVEDRPGVTRGNQWYKASAQLEFLDTPGVLWPKFEDEQVGLRLAFTGAVKDAILDVETLACLLAGLLAEHYPVLIEQRYKFAPQTTDGYETLCAIGKKRGMMVRGGEVDTERAAVMLLDEYRSGKLGRITLEFPTKTEA